MIYLHEFDRISKFNKKTKSIYPYVESFVAGGKTYVLSHEDVVNCRWYWKNEEDIDDYLITARRNPKVGITQLQQVLNTFNTSYDTAKEGYDIAHEWSGAFDETYVDNNDVPIEGYCVEITSVNINDDCYTEPWVSITDTTKKIEVTYSDSWMSGVYEYVGEYDVFEGIPE